MPEIIPDEMPALPAPVGEPVTYTLMEMRRVTAYRDGLPYKTEHHSFLWRPIHLPFGQYFQHNGEQVTICCLSTPVTEELLESGFRLYRTVGAA